MFIFEVIEDFYQYLSRATGYENIDQIRMVLTLILTIPFGFAYQYVRSPILRHFLGIVLGVAFQYIVYSWLFLYIFLQTIVVYILVRIFREKSGKVIFIQALLYLSAHQLYIYLSDDGKPPQFHSNLRPCTLFSGKILPSSSPLYLSRILIIFKVSPPCSSPPIPAVREGLGRAQHASSHTASPLPFASYECKIAL